MVDLSVTSITLIGSHLSFVMYATVKRRDKGFTSSLPVAQRARANPSVRGGDFYLPNPCFDMEDMLHMSQGHTFF